MESLVKCFPKLLMELIVNLMLLPLTSYRSQQLIMFCSNPFAIWTFEFEQWTNGDGCWATEVCELVFIYFLLLFTANFQLGDLLGNSLHCIRLWMSWGLEGDLWPWWYFQFLRFMDVFWVRHRILRYWVVMKAKFSCKFLFLLVYFASIFL